ncbi:MAG: hypothetical protein ACREIK_05525 [Nitrospiraceae bacterium]
MSSVRLLLPESRVEEDYGLVRFGPPVVGRLLDPRSGDITDTPWSYVVTGPLWGPCPKHVDGRCQIQELKPDTCRRFPLRPEEIEHFRCSYWFENLETGEIKTGRLGKISADPLDKPYLS